MNRNFVGMFAALAILSGSAGQAVSASYPLVDTGQVKTYGNGPAEIVAPLAGQPFYGQDAQVQGARPSYRDNGDGTISDLNTGLMWIQARDPKMTWAAAFSGASSSRAGGYSDWRVPSIKELYSLIDFTGKSGATADSSIPYLDTHYFGWAAGNTAIGERVIDAQDWSATEYVGTTMSGDATIFGVNFVDGRIKGYPKYKPGSGGTVGQTMYVRYVRGNPSYGMNQYASNGDGTITDRATGLMWARPDSGAGMNWQDALAWVQTKNAARTLGYNDWRMPDAKELQSLVDYTRAPKATEVSRRGPAIDPLFDISAITDEGGGANYPFYWAGTTHLDNNGGVYVAFGQALGWVQTGATYQLLDVHGAGAQRSDPKSGNPANYPHGFGPQGDVVRIDNYVRLVRDDRSAGTANQTLSVARSGSGSGSVASTPAGIDCGATCSAGFAGGSTVSLQAAPAAGSSFSGWGGDCSGTGTCTVTMGAARSVTANFVAPSPPNGTVTEYFNAAAGHYFITAFPEEAAWLDASANPDWVRTGLTFPVKAASEPGLYPVCRFYYAAAVSHFYTPYAAECSLLKAGTAWVYEADAFFLQLPDSAGNCPTGTQVLYRLYNNGIGGSPNHRYTTSRSAWEHMKSQGWVSEGTGNAGAFACVPQ